MAVTLSVVGDVREMHPIIRDEVYRIGYEAIRNACLHSRASRLDLELRYGSDLMLRVSDNGIGIDPAVLDSGKDGHFELFWEFQAILLRALAQWNENSIIVQAR
jgi:signal transduction histidine kinase